MLKDVPVVVVKRSPPLPKKKIVFPCYCFFSRLLLIKILIDMSSMMYLLFKAEIYFGKESCLWKYNYLHKLLRFSRK